MTRAETEAWCIDSAYRSPIFHATSSDAAARVLRDGFDLSYFAAGRMWGNGVYAAIDVQTAEYYLSHFGGAGMLLELRADVRRVLQVRFTLDSPKRPLFQLLALLPSGLRRFLDATIREPDQPAALTDLYVEEEYDAVEITADRFSPVIGGNQLLILDPRRVVVVRDDAADAT